MLILGNSDWSTYYLCEMSPNLDSPTVKLAGEPSTGNLYTRFDEGRGGLVYRRAPSSTLLFFLFRGLSRIS